MTRKILFLLLFIPFFFNGLFAQDLPLNVDLYAQYDRGEQRYSGSWVYSTDDGTEYALLGAYAGTAIYRIQEAGQLEEVGYIPGPETNWREITVVDDHAYVVTDVSGENHSMQVIRLDQLPEQVSLITSFNETFTKGHIIQKDIFNEQHYVYVAGTTTTEGVHIIDVSNPAQPIEAGLYDPGYYIHDCHVSGNTLFASAFYEGTIDIVDISDKSNPQLVTRIDVPDGNVHSSSLTTDGKYLFVAPEQDGLPARIFDIEDPFEPEEVARYTANPLSLVHNPYILGDFAFISHNTEGLRIVDLVDPTTPVEVGHFDTWSGESGGFNGLWSACPYLPSGKIIGGNRDDGLYVWEFEQTYAGRLYGAILDSLTNLPIPNAGISFAGNNPVAYSNALGEFRTGNVPGTYTLTISAEGYQSKFIEISFFEQSEENIIIKLVPGITPNQNPEGHTDIEVFPNPFTDKLFLKNIPQNTGILQISSSSGQQIFTSNLPLERSELSTNDWPTGLYLLEWKTTEGKVIKSWKMVKQ